MDKTQEGRRRRTKSVQHHEQWLSRGEKTGHDRVAAPVSVYPPTHSLALDFPLALSFLRRHRAIWRERREALDQIYTCSRHTHLLCFFLSRHISISQIYFPLSFGHITVIISISRPARDVYLAPAVKEDGVRGRTFLPSLNVTYGANKLLLNYLFYARTFIRNV